MHISRIQIEEGFLDGLDVQLAPGLNVVIGARGTGKTSLIELIRFCLGGEANTPETARRSRDHALSVLGDGQVTLTLQDEAGEVYVSRSYNDQAPRASGLWVKPIIFSQTEIETVGLQASGRLQLIDSFGPASEIDDSEQSVIADFASTNVELEKVRKELDDVDRQLSALSALQTELKLVSEAEAALSQTSQVIAEKTGQLDALSNRISQHSVIAAEGERVNTGLAAWYNQIQTVLSGAPGGTTPLSQQQFPYVAGEIAKAQAKLNEALQIVSASFYQVKGAVDLHVAEKVKTEDEARVIRKDIEGLSEGAGQVLRKGQQLREQQAQLNSVAEYQKIKLLSFQKLMDRRNAALDKLEAIRSKRFSARSQIVSHLNARLGPRIRINIIRNAQTHAFAVAISDALKGSNLRYAEIAKSIAEKLSPRALLEAVDNFDQDLMADVAEISHERAARVLSHLRSADFTQLGCFEIEDNISFQLLDGKDFKDFGSLSTGQRCTVVLPMVLAHQNNLIVVDQPEDHIDNAFIADTLIKAILARESGTQILFSTHNPNIPVLGGADNVIHMASDGKRGFCRTAGGLNNPAVVEAISSVMEGGAEAFARRSDFYAVLDLL